MCYTYMCAQSMYNTFVLQVHIHSTASKYYCLPDVLSLELLINYAFL